MILDNLRKAGVQNTVKKRAAHVRPARARSPATGIQADGRVHRRRRQARRVAVSHRPGVRHRRRRSRSRKPPRKRSRAVGFDLLLVCGFAFDPPRQTRGEPSSYGKLTVLPARMNPDLAMGDELLKKTGAGNLFMVFGEPDVEHHASARTASSSVEIQRRRRLRPDHRRRSAARSTDDIACWFIDTDYNGESFFVRHAYFTRRRRALREAQARPAAEIDEAAWSTLYSTTSRPFDPPKTGKIAVKVINHYGDEVLKVYPVSAK